MNYRVLSFESDTHWSKKSCLEELANYLSDIDYIVSDIEKTWIEQESYGDKKYGLKALVLGYNRKGIIDYE